jgi:hypothetical protein
MTFTYNLFFNISDLIFKRLSSLSLKKCMEKRVPLKKKMEISTLKQYKGVIHTCRLKGNNIEKSRGEKFRKFVEKKISN